MSGRGALGWALAGLLLASAPAGAAAETWNRIATPRDRDRLRAWRRAWVEALRTARSGDGGAAIAADPALFDPDRALAGPLPPVGRYHCRAVKLGGSGVTGGFVERPWGECEVAAEGDALRLSRVTGGQRPTGLVYADTDARAVFLGTMVLSDETRPMAYGRDEARDLAGLVERIGPARWRIVLPYPQYESLLDIVELAPAT